MVDGIFFEGVITNVVDPEMVKDIIVFGNSSSAEEGSSVRKSGGVATDPKIW